MVRHHSSRLTTGMLYSILVRVWKYIPHSGRRKIEMRYMTSTGTRIEIKIKYHIRNVLPDAVGPRKRTVMSVQ